MRVSVIREDGIVVVNGESYSGIDMSNVPAFIHAIQWHKDYGYIEIVDNDHEDDYHIMDTIRIDSFDEYEFLVDLWREKKREERRQDDDRSEKIAERNQKEELRIQKILDDNDKEVRKKFKIQDRENKAREKGMDAQIAKLQEKQAIATTEKIRRRQAAEADMIKVSANVNTSNV
jgi:hypothetical protein